MACCGGHSASGVTQEVQDLFTANIAGINAKLGKHWTSVHVEQAWSQVVAGHNYTAQITGNDGGKATVRIYVPLGGALPSVSAGVEGHVDGANLTH
jgi:hypothetical protein